MHPRPVLAARLLVVAALTVALLGGVLTCAGAAWAHAARIASDPAENAVLAEQPSRVSATFNEPMQTQFAAMTVIGPDGADWSDGQIGVEGAVISIGLRPAGPAGDYTVNYRATSADGHVVSGSWSYRVTSTATGSTSIATSTEAPTAPASPTTTPAASAATNTSDGGLPVWPFVAAASAIVAAGAILAVRRRQ